jgi:hypothetical protein
MILSQSAASAAVAALTTNLGASAVVNLYSGTAPAGPDTALSGNTLLVSGTVSSWSTPAYNATNGGMTTTATMSAANYAPAASGTASFGRLVTSGGVAEEQLTVGTSGTDIIMGTTTVTVGTNVAITMSLTVPSQSV